MISLIAILMPLYGALTGAGAQSMEMERIVRCDTRCSQGLQCKTKPHLFYSQCRSPPGCLNSSAAFSKVGLSTVMSCKGRQKCSLHLRVSAVLQPSELVHGVSICTETAGMLSHCQMVSFPRTSRKKRTRQQVEVESDCFDVFPGQDVEVTLNTVPSYCGVMWTGAYHVPECSSGNLRSHIPECITGRLQYLVNPEKKEVVVSVSDMLEDEDYRLRLCHKDFICAGTGASALIKKEERTRNVTLRYSRPLPCLCIEGWSDMTDAPRVQVCPFKDRVEELWFGVSFDLVEETLSWEPACPTLAVISLCQKGEEDVCMDLPHAMQTAGRGKITFTKVEPHPQLCMKFTAGSQSWTKCPFAKGNFQVWEAEVLASASGHQEVLMLSQITATFSVGVCVRSERSPLCQPIDTLTVDMKNHKPVTLNLTGDLCKPNSCLQVRRLDVNYAATVLNCHLQCVLQNDAAETASVIPASKDGNLSVTWAVVPAGVCLAVIIIVTLMVHAMRTEPPPLATDCVVPAFQTIPSLHSQISVSDPTQLEDIEKASLLIN